MNAIPVPVKNIFLAEDDEDDCLLFEEALRELSQETQLTIARDGDVLLSILDEMVPPPPHVIFLDLNMPRKNGIECLKEIRSTAKLTDIPVVIFSTTSNPESIDTTYSLGATYYVCKPRTYPLYKKAIKTILSFDLNQDNPQPARHSYFLQIT